MRTDIDNAKDQIIQALESGTPRFEICRQFDCKYETLLSRLKKWHVDHLKNQSGKGIAAHAERVKAAEYLVYGSRIKGHRLKLKLLEEGYKEHRCERCGNSKWMDEPIPLEIHHIDGDHFNNTIENLQILCPTCHAQQPGNAGAGMKRKHPQVAELV